MGINYYLRAKKPVEYYPTYHIAKRSYGWLPLFQAIPEGDMSPIDEEEDGVYTQLPIRSFGDIRKLVSSGDYEIIDEYDRTYTWEEFYKEVASPYKQEPQRQSHKTSGLNVYTDLEGYEFTPQDFR